MAKIYEQEIPSYIYDYWTQVFRKDYGAEPPTKTQRRTPFELAYKAGLGPPRGSSPAYDGTPAQRHQRTIFRAAVDSFNMQPPTGGVEPPNIGPRGRDWWYQQAITSGLWYYNYYMQLTMNAYIAGNTPAWAMIHEQPQNEGILSFALGTHNNRYKLYTNQLYTPIGRYHNYLQLARDDILFYVWKPTDMKYYYYLLLSLYLYNINYMSCPNLRLDISALRGNPLDGDDYTYNEIQNFIGPTLSYLILHTSDNNKYSLFDFTELNRLAHAEPPYTGFCVSSKDVGSLLSPRFQYAWTHCNISLLNKPYFTGEF